MRSIFGEHVCAVDVYVHIHAWRYMTLCIHRSTSNARDVEWNFPRNQQSRVAYVTVIMATDDNFWISGKYFLDFWNFFDNAQNMSLEFWLIFEFCIPIIRKKKKNDQIIWKALTLGHAARYRVQHYVDLRVRRGTRLSSSQDKLNLRFKLVDLCDREDSHVARAHAQPAS